MTTQSGGRPSFGDADAERARFGIAHEDVARSTCVADADGSVGSVVAVERSIERLAAEWDALADRAGAPPFLRPGWVAAWWRAFGKGTLEILTVRQRGRVVGVLPLYRRRGALRSTSNWHTPIFGSVTDHSDAGQELARALFSRGRRRASVAFVDLHGPDLDACRSAAEAAHYRVLVRTLQRSPYVEIDRDWETYQAGLSRNLRSSLSRGLRRLEEEGRVALEVADRSERLDELLAEGFRLEASGWKGSGGTAIASRPETRSFYGDVARWAARRGWLRLVFLRVDGRAVAFQYALEEGGVYYPLKGGYDPAFRRVSPMNLIIHMTLARAFSTGLARYELLGGAEPWKLRWTSSCRDSVLFHAFAPTVPGLLDWGSLAYGRPIAKRAHLAALVRLFRR